MFFIKTFLYLLFIACIHAQLEIMIEGKEGWAKKLPCWRLNVFVIKVLLGKELTGYHFYLMILFISLFHGILLVTPWTFGKELLVTGSFFWYWIFEDFLWFLANKHYGLKSFRKGKIKWQIQY